MRLEWQLIKFKHIEVQVPFFFTCFGVFGVHSLSTTKPHTTQTNTRVKILIIYTKYIPPSQNTLVQLIGAFDPLANKLCRLGGRTCI